MKIIIATGIYPPSIGGPATYSKLVFDELRKREIDVQVLSFDLVRRLPKILRHAVYFFHLFLKSFKADTIFAQDTVSVGLPALLVSSILRKKFLIRVPGDYAWEQGVQRFGVTDSIDDFQNKKYGLKVEFLRKIQRTVVSHADVVITPSNYFKNLVALWMKDTSKLHTIYNGIDFESAGTKQECRKRLGIDLDAVVVVSAGRLVPWKGFKEVISSVKALSESIPEVKLFILGDGPQRQDLQNFIRDNKVDDQVVITGNLARRDLLTYLCASDIFILNSNFESFSFQTVEAMYSGACVLVSKIGSLPELVDDKLSGILFEVNNEYEMTSAMKSAIDHPTQAETMRLEATKKARNFSIDNTINALIRFLK